MDSTGARNTLVATVRLGLQQTPVEADPEVVEAPAVGPHLDHDLHDVAAGESRPGSLEFLRIEYVVFGRRKLHGEDEMQKVEGR